MRVNLTIVFTLTLLVLMVAAGSVSAMLGFKLGHEALKDVTQPDVRTGHKFKGRNGTLEPGAVATIPEADILANVNKWIESKGKHPKPEKPQQEKKQNKSASDKKNQSADAAPLQPGFPIATQNQGVKLEVVSAHDSGGFFLMKVNFKNEGNRDVHFLPSFLAVTDEQGQELSATTNGMPEDLPANGQSFSGTVSIPINLLDNVKNVSMTLTDYPDQQVRLQLTGIPVKI
ncbi:MAG: hypothetical protein JOZ78_04915 [Chroococcidiopsidaceae cyanobacterium CP_BM_ER_R8_30]|nr:hypothetical protein [Chroococcidiopsidaceae cyanobacterium CP_BM_ER_R8_30]